MSNGIRPRVYQPSRACALRAILDASAGLTRVLNLAVALFMALLVIPYVWLPGLGAHGAVALGIAIIVGAMAWAVWSLKSAHGGLERAGRLGGLEGWNGIIYSNPKDSRLWVPKISGYSTTLNFAHRRAWPVLGSILVLSLGTAALGVVSASLDHPLTLTCRRRTIPMARAPH